MILVRIRPVTPHSNTTPFCEHTVDSRNVPAFYRSHRARRNHLMGRSPDLCANRASYVLEGLNLCHHHAGLRALEILMEQQT